MTEQTTAHINYVQLQGMVDNAHTNLLNAIRNLITANDNPNFKVGDAEREYTLRSITDCRNDLDVLERELKK
jgi:phage regulator Rha-like protein